MSELLTPSTTPDEAANLLATGKVSPSAFSEWMTARLVANGNGTPSGWHPVPPVMKVTQSGGIQLRGVETVRYGGLNVKAETLEYLAKPEVQEALAAFVAKHREVITQRTKVRKAELAADRKAAAEKLAAEKAAGTLSPA